MADEPFRLISEPAVIPPGAKRPPIVTGFSVMVACNDTRNGAFVGRFDMADLIAPDGDIALNFTGDGFTSIRFSRENDRIRLGSPKRRWFRALKCSRWSGNWCWNQFWLTDRGTARFLRMVASVFGVDGGWTSLVERIEAGERITDEMLRQAIGRE